MSSDEIGPQTTPVALTELAFGAWEPILEQLRARYETTAGEQPITFGKLAVQGTMAAQIFHASSLSALHGASKRAATTAGAQLPIASKRVPQFAPSLYPPLRLPLNAQPHAVMAPEVCASA